MDTSPVKQWLCAVCAMCAVLSAVPGIRADAAQQEAPIKSVEANSYEAYLASHARTLPDAPTVTVDVADFAAPKGFAHTEVMEIADGRTGTAVHTGEDGYIEWKVDIKTEAFYNISVLYYPREGKGSGIVRRLKLDGKLPFAEAGNIEFGRVYKNDGEIKTDSRGNQLRPVQVEAPGWIWADIRDNLGYYPEPLKFYLGKGVHILRFESLREPMTIAEIKLWRVAPPRGYEAVKKEYAKKDYQPATDVYVEIQGEHAALKSDNMMYPVQDNSSPAIHDSSHDKIILNTIGGSKWQRYGQWLEWRFYAPEDGLYQIGVKAIQNIASGKASFRTLYIDGEIPFAEAQNIKFPYDTGWRTTVLSDLSGNPYRFYLKKGDHTLRLAVSLGDFGAVARSIGDAMSALNEIYLDFLMVTGTNPDRNRDYSFEKILPGTIEKLRQQSKSLRELYGRYIGINGMDNSHSLLIKKLSAQALKMADNPEKIAKLLSDFYSNVSSLGTVFTEVKQQPLTIDYIAVYAPGTALPKTNAGFFPLLWYAVKQFVTSFTIDYSLIGDGGADAQTVTVWMSQGRDQANSLNQLIINDFTPHNGIKAGLQLVPAGTLLSATLAGKGPDVALNNGPSDPLNYAIRGAVRDVSEFPDADGVVARFRPSAMEPLTYRGGIYGLPETQTFPMMFYRADIMEDLKLTVPSTWDEVVALIPLLQKRSLNFALPAPYAAAAVGAGLPAYAMFLFQNGGKFYNNDDTSALNDTVAVDAFYRWISFYNLYQLPTQFDFMNRFRSGEIPIGIADYSTYNALSIFAPELEGRWGFAPVPGTQKPDGSVDISAASSISATVIMQAAKNPQAAWTFVKWWLSSSVQSSYANDLESIMGTAGRYQPANIETLYTIPWKTADFKILMKQWEHTRGIPEVPGSYMTPRYIDFAFKKASSAVTTSRYQALILPDEILRDATKKIDMEIDKKRREFNILSEG